VVSNSPAARSGELQCWIQLRAEALRHVVGEASPAVVAPATLQKEQNKNRLGQDSNLQPLASKANALSINVWR
jgi:hypothetical protein